MTDQAPAHADGAAAKRRLPHSIASLESVPFRWLSGSMLTFFLSMQAGFLIRSLLAWDLTHSELSLAYINLVIAVPMMVGSFIAGAVIDRMERRRIVIVGQSLIMLAELTVLVLMFLDILQFWHLLATSFSMGVMYPFIMPTRTAMVMNLVGRERMGNAMALMTASQNIARVLGPSLAGGLIPFIGLKGAFIVSLVLYTASTLTMFALPKAIPVPSGRSLLRDVAYSFTYISQHRPMLLTVLFGILPLLLTLPVFSMLVVFTEDVWQTGEVGLGILMAMIGLGGITGSMLVARLGDRVRVRVGNLTMTNHPIHIHGIEFEVTGTDGGPVPKSARWPEVTTDVAVGQMRQIEFIANEPGDWAMHCHKSHHTMGAMGHDVPTLIGVDHRGLVKPLQRVNPDYMVMGERGMADMGEMEMELPANTFPMMTGTGPYGPIEMGGMFTTLKVRADQKAGDYRDPGWYQQPPNTQSRLVETPDAAPRAATPNGTPQGTAKKPEAGKGHAHH